jgi:MFS superfamily sulfate permease-like transporter
MSNHVHTIKCIPDHVLTGMTCAIARRLWGQMRILTGAPALERIAGQCANVLTNATCIEALTRALQG